MKTILTSTPKATFAVAFLIILFGRTEAAAQPELPKPTGPRQTGRMSFHWKDSARPDVTAHSYGKLTP